MGPARAQQVLDTALAWSVINRHFDVADFLLEHGADINTNWNSHEPASILHHLVFLPNPYESMQFLIDRGIDMTIKDYRWDGRHRVGRATATTTRRWPSGWRRRNGSGNRDDEHAPHILDLLGRIVSSMFIRVNSRCAHQVLIERPPCYARNSAAWSVAHSRKVRGGAPVSSANVDVTNAG